MKQFYFLVLFFIIIGNQSHCQTYAGLPDSSHVLVVYNSNSSISDSVMDYYKTARGIPAENIVALDGLVSKDITIDGSTHRVIIAQEGDIIRDSINHEGPFGATRHA